MHLQSIQRSDLQVNVIVEELLHHGLERQQQLLLFIQLLLTGSCKLLFVVLGVNFVSNELQKAGRQEDGEHHWEMFLPKMLSDALDEHNRRLLIKGNRFISRLTPSGGRFTAVPGHKDVDEASVGVEFRRDVVFDPLVDGLWRGIYFDLLQQLLL